MPSVTISANGRSMVLTRDTREELFAAIERARKAYPDLDVDSSTYTPDAQQDAPRIEQGGPWGAALRGLRQGATFGFADEVDALVNQNRLGERVQVAGQPEPSNYAIARDTYRAQNDAAQQEYPGAYLAGEIGGGLAVPGAGGAKTVAAVSKGSRLGRLAGVGAAEGAVAGAGYSSGDDAIDIMRDMGIAGAAGMAAAPAIGIGGELALRGANALGRGIGNQLFESPTHKAGRFVERAMRGDEVTPDRIARLAVDTQGAGVGADLGPNLRELAYAARAKSPTGTRLARDLEQARQTGQRGRIDTAIRQGVDPEWNQNYKQYVEKLTRETKKRAAPLYRDAWAQPIEANDMMVAINSRVENDFPSIFRNAKRMQALEFPYSQGETAWWDFLGRAIGDEVEGARRAGNDQMAAGLNNLKQRLDKEVYDQVPGLEEARIQYHSDKKIEEAAEFGRSLVKDRKIGGEDVLDSVKGFSPGEREAFGVGFVRGLRDQVLNSSVRGDASKKLDNTYRLRDVIQAAFPRSVDAERFLQKMVGEQEMAETHLMLNKNSLTDIRNAARDRATDVANVGIMAATKNIPGLILSGLRRIFGTELDEETATEISRLLFNQLDAAAVQRLSQRATPPPARVPQSIGNAVGGLAASTLIPQEIN